jgi:hypothetical protein
VVVARDASPLKLTVAAETLNVEEEKSSPPPVRVRVLETVCTRLVPRFRVPEAMVRVGVVKSLVVTVVPPVPFWVKFKAVTEALGVKVWAELPVKAKVLEDDAVTVVEERLTLPVALRLDEAKLSPPAPDIPATVCVKPEPRLSVPEVKVTLPAVKALVRMVVPPAPF